MNRYSKIYVAGHRGMVGSAIVRKLKSEGFTNLILKTSTELDLTKQREVDRFFEIEQPEYVFLAAAKVGGIVANNTFPADFMYDNIMIEMNVIHAAFVNHTQKLLLLGSSCIYPRMATQPIKENSLLTGELEKTNEAYALAKISGLKYCEYLNTQYGTQFISAMPSNLYGPNDNYHPEHSHVLPALIRRFQEAKENQQPNVTVWGTGEVFREFLYVDDCADACIYLMNHYNDSGTINIGTGRDLSIQDLANLVKIITGYEGKILYDTSRPDGTPKKLLDVSKLRKLGWSYQTELREGIELAYRDFLTQRVRV